MEPDTQRPETMTEAEIRKKAEKRVSQRTALLSHIGAYVVVNTFLIIVWALAGAGYPWFLWVMAGWGLGLAINIVSYFAGSKGEAARDRMVQKEMDKIKEEEQ